MILNNYKFMFKIFWPFIAIIIFFFSNPVDDDFLTNQRATSCRRKRQNSSIIHKLLLLLCVSDLCVIIGLLASFSLPNIWSYCNHIWPYLAPWWIPILHIALLTSVYTTVLISLERYAWIVYVCNFKHCWFFNKENFK